MPRKIRAFPDWGVGSDPTYRDYGYAQYFATTVDLSGVSNGGYQLVMRVKNPLEAVSGNAKKLRFANAAQNADGWLGLGAMTVGTGGPTTPSVEAESPANTLTGGAVTASCSGCSGGSKVGYIGNGAALTFNQVAASTAGTRTLAISYLSALPRTATIRVNNGTATTVSFPATADWNTVGVRTLPVTLAAGNNTITIANPGDWAPDIDKITITGG
jgi:hypothetical protein